MVCRLGISEQKREGRCCVSRPTFLGLPPQLRGTMRDTAEFNRFFAEMTAMGRVGVADDVGPMIASLLGEENRWLTAQRIEVSGGQGI